MRTIRNVALWLGSLFLSVSRFSFIYGPASFFIVFGITMIFALPVALLYLPIVISVKDAGGRTRLENSGKRHFHRTCRPSPLVFLRLD